MLVGMIVAPATENTPNAGGLTLVRECEIKEACSRHPKDNV